ncbi:hypothetical protein FQR65_LT14397 [Abscondita terminalis]|nr:hypothetical protein FQR65_LT14397 [Abscondita terminalis]
MEDELAEFLIQCGIDVESIATMKEQKINFSTIRAMSSTELGRFVQRMGDIYKIKEFADHYINQNKPTSTTLLTFAQKLKTKISHVEGTMGATNKSCEAKNRTSSSPKSFKPTRRISINWKCNNKIVRAEEGGGARQIDAPKSFKKKDILEKAIDLYFSNGKSIKKGPLADYDVDLLDFAANIFDDNLTVEQIFAMTGFTRLNFYMYTTLKPELAEKRKKQKVQKGKKKIQISSSSEDEPSNNHTPQTRHQRKRKQNSEYSLSTSLSTEFGENEDVKDVSNSETTNCLTNEIFYLEEFLNIQSPGPTDVVPTAVEFPVTSTNFIDLADTAVDDLQNEVYDSIKRFEQPGEQALDLESELTAIRHTIKVEKPLLVNACREDPVSSLRNATKRSTFSPDQKIDVQFVDIDQVPEGAIDEGGPSRELFRLSLKQLQDSEIFLGSEGHKIFAFNLTALGKDKYLYAGKIFAMSIIHGGPRPNFLSKTIFDYLASGFGCPVADDLQNTPFQMH